MGISSGSALTSTMYYVQAEEDGKFFVTGDVLHVEAADDPPDEGLRVLSESAQMVLYSWKHSART